ncbi:hypothetical protein [Kaarinaea lacus]
MALSQILTTALDELFKTEQRLADFVRIKPRKYRSTTAYAELEIDIALDKYWHKSKGGKVIVDLYAFVPEIQEKIHALHQDWDEPDYSKPLYYFQYRGNASEFDPSWTVHSEQDINEFVEQVSRWLNSDGLPWFDNFNSFNTVVSFLQKENRPYALAELYAAYSDRTQALQFLFKYLSALPRDIESQLQKLCDKNLLSENDKAYLLKASIQTEQEYDKRINTWFLEKEDT